MKLEVPNLKAFSSDAVPLMEGSKGSVAAKLREHQGLNHLLNVHYIHHHLPLACSDSSNQLNFLKDFELTLMQFWVFSNNSPKRLNVYLNVADKLHNIETLPDKKPKNVVKTVKKAVSTRWISLHASVDGVYEEYGGLLETFSILEIEGGSGCSMSKGFSKSWKSLKFIGMLYTLRVM